MTTPASSSTAQRTVAQPGDTDVLTPVRSPAKRINVAVNAETLAALEYVSTRENVSLTEAVRRLIGIGDVMYRAVKDDGAELLLRTDDETKQVLIL